MEKSDNLDRRILISVVGDSRKKLSISQVVKPFLHEKSDRALRMRVDRLSILGFLSREKYPGCVLISITERGEAMAFSEVEPHGI